MERDPREPLPDRLLALRTARNLSRSRLSRATVQPGDEGVAEITIRLLETGERQGGNPDTLAKLARALHVPEEQFPEIELARARRLFDPQQVGLAEALANYELLAAVFPGAGRADQLTEAIERRNGGPDPVAQQAAAILRRLSEALLRERGSTSPAAPQPAAAADQPAPRGRRRRPAA